jgi:hypothetical protein
MNNLRTGVRPSGVSKRSASAGGLGPHCPLHIEREASLCLALHLSATQATLWPYPSAALGERRHLLCEFQTLLISAACGQLVPGQCQACRLPAARLGVSSGLNARSHQGRSVRLTGNHVCATAQIKSPGRLGVLPRLFTRRKRGECETPPSQRATYRSFDYGSVGLWAHD